ncbi:MAG TPA: class I SAM-dependent methyltransferase [Bryobacteraceae bacterium]|nr:class I SAM-dependent methyltransferase [Bryobacteraceae bacterium]
MTEPAADACLACGASEFRTLFSATDRLYRTTDKYFEIVECLTCRLLRLYPRPTPAALRTYYPPDYWFMPGDSLPERMEERYRRFVLADHVAFVSRALEDAAEEGPVLDVGCGGGLFLRMLKEQGYPVTGLDFSHKAAAVAWSAKAVPCVAADLASAPFRAASCAAVTMFHVLEHLTDPAAYLNAAHALLRPGGRLIVQVPNAACWQFLLLGENWTGIDVPRHLINFRARDLEALVEACGFEVLRRKHFSLRDNPAGLATSMAPWLDPMARRIRGLSEGTALKLFKDALYFGLVVASVPFTALEACCRAGSTIMIEARKKP